MYSRLGSAHLKSACQGSSSTCLKLLDSFTPAWFSSLRLDFLHSGLIFFTPAWFFCGLAPANISNVPNFVAGSPQPPPKNVWAVVAAAAWRSQFRLVYVSNTVYANNGHRASCEVFHKLLHGSHLVIITSKLLQVTDRNLGVIGALVCLAKLRGRARKTLRAYFQNNWSTFYIPILRLGEDLVLGSATHGYLSWDAEGLSPKNHALVSRSFSRH